MEAFLKKIEALGVTITSDARMLARQYKATELPFSRFIRALTLADFYDNPYGRYSCPYSPAASPTALRNSRPDPAVDMPSM